MTTKKRTGAESEHGRRANSLELSALFEFSTVINSTPDLKFILAHFLLTLMGKLLATRGLIMLRKEGRLFAVEQVRGLPAATVGSEFEIGKVGPRILEIDKDGEATLPWLGFLKENNVDLVVPLIAHGKCLGIAGFGRGLLRRKLTAKEQAYIKSLTNSAAAAIEKGLMITELGEVNRRLDRKVQELNTLFELSKEFNSVLDADRLTKLLIFSIIGQIGARKYFLSLVEGDKVDVVASRMDVQPGPDLNAYLATATEPFLVSAPHRKGGAQAKLILEELGIRVIVPLRLQNKTKGILGLGDKMGSGVYTPADLEFLSSLGNLAIVSLENVRLFRDTLEKQRMEDELQIAKGIQRGLLPSALPKIPRCELAAVNISSKEVGGDYYDVIALDPERYVLAIGDVSGKGTPASLLMANLQATIRALVPLGLPLSELTARVNDLICENTGTDRFITFFWGIIDAGAGSMKYVSAGHNPPFLIHADASIDRLSEGGIILGIMKALVPYKEGEVRLSKGDVLVLFTDGVSEAMNEAGEEWGEEPLERIVKEHLTEPAEAILNRVVEGIQQHNKGTQQSDDITLIVAKMTE